MRTRPFANGLGTGPWIDRQTVRRIGPGQEPLGGESYRASVSPLTWTPSRIPGCNSELAEIENRLSGVRDSRLSRRPAEDQVSLVWCHTWNEGSKRRNEDVQRPSEDASLGVDAPTLHPL